MKNYKINRMRSNKKSRKPLVKLNMKKLFWKKICFKKIKRAFRAIK